MRKDIIKPSLYADNPEELMVGMLSALIAAAAWLVLATFLNLPVSTTHGMGAHDTHEPTHNSRARTHPCSLPGA